MFVKKTSLWLWIVFSLETVFALKLYLDPIGPCNHDLFHIVSILFFLPSAAIIEVMYMIWPALEEVGEFTILNIIVAVQTALLIGMCLLISSILKRIKFKRGSQ